MHNGFWSLLKYRMGSNAKHALKRTAALALLSLVMLAAGCTSLSDMFGLGGGEEQPEPLVNGTTTGNTLNGGFAVKDGNDLLVYYTSGNAYPKGSLVRSNPETGENSLVMDEAGLYMNLKDGVLYYCLGDGIYRARLDAPQPERLLEGEYTLLQISGSKMYYISGGAVGCASLDGEPAELSAIDNASCLNVYGDRLYWTDTESGQICRSDLDGGDRNVLYDKPVDMFYIIDDVIYFIDGADGLLKRIALEIDPETLETLTAEACSGFNINRSGLYYTLSNDGLCYNAGVDGLQARAIEDLGSSAWHRVCMFGEGAMIVRQEDLPS